MARRKPDNKYKKALDGRTNNGQKKGDKQLRAIQKELKGIDKSNRAKRDRVQAQAVKGIKEVYGSEAEFWKHIAIMSKDSYNHLKMLTEYAVGKPSDSSGPSISKSIDVPIINFFSSDTTPERDKLDNTIDISHEEDEDLDE